MEKSIGEFEEVNGRDLLEEAGQNLGAARRGCLSRRFGSKEVTFMELEHDRWMAICVCEVLDCCVVVALTVGQVRELSMGRTERRAIHEVLPNVCLEVREIFITGMTPVEFDQRVRSRVLPKNVYEKMGYVFEAIA